MNTFKAGTVLLFFQNYHLEKNLSLSKREVDICRGKDKSRKEKIKRRNLKKQGRKEEKKEGRKEEEKK